MCVVDKDRNCCSLIQSNYMGFGSKHVPGDVGFAMQNRGALFALDDTHLNRLEPHKRPFHTIIPAFVTKDGKPWFCFGVMGGDMQAQGHVQVLVNMIDFGMNVQAAGDAARVMHTGSATPTGLPAEGVRRGQRRAGDLRSQAIAAAPRQGPRRHADAPLAAPTAATKAFSSTGSTACCTGRPNRGRTASRRGTDVERAIAAAKLAPMNEAGRSTRERIAAAGPHYYPLVLLLCAWPAASVARSLLSAAGDGRGG